MDTDLRDRIAHAFPVDPVPDEAARLKRIDRTVRETMTDRPSRRRRRYLAPIMSAAVLIVAATTAIAASGGLPSWLDPSKSAGKIGAFREPQTGTSDLLAAFVAPKTDARDHMDAHMIGAMEEHLQQNDPDEELLGSTYYRELLDWTDPRDRRHEIVAIPTSAGGVCVFVKTSLPSPKRGGSGMAGCTVKLDADRPIGATGTADSGHDVDICGVMADDVAEIVVTQRNRNRSAAHLGTNAFCWTAHTERYDRSAALANPAFLDVTTDDGRTRRFTVLGEPMREAVAKARAVRASRISKCRAYPEPKPAVCRALPALGVPGAFGTEGL